MNKSIVKIEDVEWLPHDIENIGSTKPHYALLLFIAE
jgi:hypothetical protein